MTDFLFTSPQRISAILLEPFHQIFYKQNIAILKIQKRILSTSNLYEYVIPLLSEDNPNLSINIFSFLI